jgi:hypothetical protein
MGVRAGSGTVCASPVVVYNCSVPRQVAKAYTAAVVALHVW